MKHEANHARQTKLKSILQPCSSSAITALSSAILYLLMTRHELDKSRDVWNLSTLLHGTTVARICYALQEQATRTELTVRGCSNDSLPSHNAASLTIVWTETTLTRETFNCTALFRSDVVVIVVYACSKRHIGHIYAGSFLTEQYNTTQPKTSEEKALRTPLLLYIVFC